jgi:CheY-like chemotaxis protein
MNNFQSSSARAAEHLALSSFLRKRVQSECLSPAVLVVDNSSIDACLILVPLRRLLGVDATIVIVESIAAMKGALEQRTFDVIVLDDHMDGGARAETTLPLIRAHQSTVPVILVAHLLTRLRKSQLNQMGCVGVFEKEDLNSVVLGGALLTALGHPTC